MGLLDWGEPMWVFFQGGWEIHGTRKASLVESCTYRNSGQGALWAGLPSCLLGIHVYLPFFHSTQSLIFYPPLLPQPMWSQFRGKLRKEGMTNWSWTSCSLLLAAVTGSGLGTPPKLMHSRRLSGHLCRRLGPKDSLYPRIGRVEIGRLHFFYQKEGQLRVKLKHRAGHS